MMTRKEAVQMLAGKGVGEFIVRPGAAKHGEGAYVLSRVGRSNLVHDLITPVSVGKKTKYELKKKRFVLVLRLRLRLRLLSSSSASQPCMCALRLCVCVCARVRVRMLKSAKCCDLPVA